MEVTADADVGRLLIDGEVDAMIFPHPPATCIFDEVVSGKA